MRLVVLTDEGVILEEWMRIEFLNLQKKEVQFELTEQIRNTIDAYEQNPQTKRR